jgi:hypothetical protein
MPNGSKGFIPAPGRSNLNVCFPPKETLKIASLDSEFGTEPTLGKLINPRSSEASYASEGSRQWLSTTPKLMEVCY